MRPLSEPTAKVAAKSFSRKYIALGRIVKSWESVIGKKLAGKAQPMKIHYRKRKKGQKPEAMLDIAVSSAEATLLHYQKDLILERINHIFGESWIGDIRFISVSDIKPRSQKKKPLRDLNIKDHNTLSDMLDCVVDETLKLRLNSLGQEILMQDKGSL